MTYAKTAVAQNTVIQIIGKGISTLIGLATFGILWRILSPTEYGNLTLALTFLGVFATFVDFGLTLTTSQLMSERRDQEQAILGNLLSLRLVSAGVFLICAPIVALFFPYDRIVVILIAIGILSYYSASLFQMLGSVFQRNLDTAKPLIAETANRLIGFIGICLVGFFHGSLQSIMWVFVLGNVLQLILILSFLRKTMHVRIQYSWSIWKLIISRSWPIGISIFFNLIYLKGDIVFLSLFRSEAEVGLYGTAYKVIEVIASLPVMFMGLMLPILVTAWTEKNKERFEHVLQDAFDFFTIIGFPIAIGLALVAKPAIVFVAGETFADAGPVLYILGPALLFVFYGALFGHAVVGVNKQRPMIWTYIGVSLITVFGYLWSIPQYGMYGAAVWTFISEGLIALIACIVTLRVSQAHIRLHMLFKVIISTCIMTLAVLTIPLPHVLLTVCLGALVYVITLTLLGGPTWQQIKQLLRQKQSTNI